jgi:type VI secretion system protein VasG
VHEIFFQVFDKGVMEDGEGVLIDFRNTLIILTTNVGTDLIAAMCKDSPVLEEITGALRKPLLKAFPAALLGRMVVIPYYPLNDATLGTIVRLQLERIVSRVRKNHSVELTYDDAVVSLIASRCTEPESGGRMIDAILTNTMLPQIGRELLGRLRDGTGTRRVQVRVVNDAFDCQFE